MSDRSVLAATWRMVRDLLEAVAGLEVADPEHVRGYVSETVSGWVDEHAVDGLDPIDVLWFAEGEVDRLRRAVGVLRGVVDDLILADVAENGAVRLGDTVFRDVSARQRRIVDRDRLVAWVGPERIGDVFRLDDSNLRTTALEAVARERAAAEYPDDEEAAAGLTETILDTFLAWNDPAPGTPARKLEKVPVTRVRWAAQLAHGERRR